MHRLLIALALSLAASPALAGDFFVAGGLGSSWATGSAGGVNLFPDTFGGAPFENTGSDGDESPTYGGSLGFQWRMHEVVPWWDWVPRWAVRLAFETDGFTPATPYSVSFDALTTMANVSLDLPVHPPVAMLFGRVSILEPARIYGSVGLGAANIEFATGDTIVAGDFDDWGFAWQAGAGIGYGVSQHVDLMAGYRRVDLGKVKVKLQDVGALAVPTFRGTHEMDLHANALVMQVRIKFLSIDWPGGRKL